MIYRILSARVRLAIAVVLLAPVGAALAGFAFVEARLGPGTCGGTDGPPCAPGTGPAFSAMFVALMVLVPLGVMIAWKEHPELLPTAVALVFGGIAVGVFPSRFIADPITERTTPTWWWVGVTGGLAAIAIVAAISVVVLRGDTHR